MKRLPPLCPSATFCKSNRHNSHLFILLVGVFFLGVSVRLHAQTLTFTGTKPYVDLASPISADPRSAPHRAAKL
jgi:hypothetical protein